MSDRTQQAFSTLQLKSQDKNRLSVTVYQQRWLK
jgi:hypothetical protein